MDMRARLLRAVAARPRVLLLTAVGGTGVRLAVERELRRRDVPQALTPADADVLFTAGEFAPEAAGAVERLWQDMPAPRIRTGARTAQEAPAALAAACAALADPHRSQRRSAQPPERQQSASPAAHAHGDEHAHEHGDEHMDMTPYGLPMAELGPDRDGLTLDRLHLALGPHLPHWPAGLIVHVTLQGDVIQQARCETSAPAEPEQPAFWSGPWLRAAAGEHVTTGEAARRRAAAHLDSLGRFLAVAGLRPAATAARRLRDDVLDGSPYEQVRARAGQLSRRVGRSRTLHWLTSGIGGPSVTELPHAEGDVPARYRQWLRETAQDLARMDDPDPLDPYAGDTPRGRLDPARPPSRALVDALPRLLEGAELAAARLIVACLDPDIDELAVAAGAVAGG